MAGPAASGGDVPAAALRTHPPSFPDLRRHGHVPQYPCGISVLARGGDAASPGGRPPGTPRWPAARFLRHRAVALLAEELGWPGCWPGDGLAGCAGARALVAPG